MADRDGMMLTFQSNMYIEHPMSTTDPGTPRGRASTCSATRRCCTSTRRRSTT